MAVPEQVAKASINKTLRASVEVNSQLWPIIGANELAETPASSAIESVPLFLLTESYPGDDTPGQFQFGWRQTPGSAIDEYLISVGEDKKAVTLDFRVPGEVSYTPSAPSTDKFSIKAASSAGDSSKGLSEIVGGNNAGSAASGVTVPGWTIDDNIRVGSVLQLDGKPAGTNEHGLDANGRKADLHVVAAILFTGATKRLFTKGRPVLNEQGPFKVYDPNTVYRVTGTGVSFANDTAGTVAIGRLVMTMDSVPTFDVIRADQVDKAYSVAA